MGKRDYIPNIVFFIRLALLVLILGSMIWLDDVITGVLYLLSLSMLVVEILLGSEMKKNSVFEHYAVPTTNRLLVVLPLVCIAVRGDMNVWLLCIAVFFDLFAAVCSAVEKRREENNSKQKGKTLNYGKLVYDVYLLLVFCAIFLYFFLPGFSVFVMYAAVIVCALYIIMQSFRVPAGAEEACLETKGGVQVNGGDDTEDIEVEESEKLTRELQGDNARQNEIIE